MCDSFVGVLGSFAVWGTVFSCCDCTMAYARKKEDPWNAISAGFLTGGILAARAGFKQMVKNAVVGGVILGLIEGVSIGVSRVLLPMYEQQVRHFFCYANIDNLIHFGVALTFTICASFYCNV